MKLLPSAVSLALIGLVLTATGGCYRSPDITWHQPHVYKGKQDPLHSTLQGGELQKQLAQRFQSVQTDR